MHRLRTFAIVAKDVAYGLPLAKCPEPFHFNCRVMDEYVAVVLPGNKPISLLVAEPLDLSSAL